MLTPCAGEEPITSYFRRLGSAGKRKENTRVFKRKQPPPIEVEISQPSAKKAKTQRKLALCDTQQDAGRATASGTLAPKSGAPLGQTESFVSIPRDSSTTPPPIEHLSRGAPVHVEGVNSLSTLGTGRRLVTTLHPLETSPPSEAPRRRDPLALPSTPELPQLPINSANGRSTIPTVPRRVAFRVKEPYVGRRRSLSPPGSTSPTVKSSSSFLGSSLDPAVNHPLLEPSSNERCTEHYSLGGVHESTDTSESSHRDDASGLPVPSQSLVPSSQTQDYGGVLLDDSPGPSKLSSYSSASCLSPRFLRPHLPNQSTLTSAGIAEGNDDGEFVESSQSQYMLPLHVSPRWKRNMLRTYFSDPPSSSERNMPRLAEETIPSSQSQEIELTISRGIAISECLPCVGAHAARSSPKRFRTRDHGQPSFQDRTPSEELFSVPLRRINVDEMPQEDSEVLQPDIAFANPHPDESTTEDESDDESSIVPARSAGRTTYSKATRIETTIGVLSAQSLSGESGNLLESLPEAVEDFRNMFGEGDGSYPDDFPMSLR
ncbi:hypothetical protein Hypma_009653 [Hypsizygus marmoreus]|uniref:Uncharacterized protein n=1 Tax=Hypsizygus marmoreus TaxID=39966 RepID=A0A369JLT7_HYPMA|nr:hypothetical protein Hypma_009653 [Hypsizygus marmoreus]